MSATSATDIARICKRTTSMKERSGNALNSTD